MGFGKSSGQARQRPARSFDALRHTRENRMSNFKGRGAPAATDAASPKKCIDNSSGATGDDDANLIRCCAKARPGGPARKITPLRQASAGAL